jgi:hypothetical protein
VAATSRATGQGKEAMPGTGSRRCIIQGSSTTITEMLTIGVAISQFTSGARRVLGVGVPRNTERYTRVRLRAVRPLVSRNTAAISGAAGRIASTTSP